MTLDRITNWLSWLYFAGVAAAFALLSIFGDKTWVAWFFLIAFFWGVAIDDIARMIYRLTRGRRERKAERILRELRDDPDLYR